LSKTTWRISCRSVPDVFVEAYAPADYVDAVNTLALPRHLKREDMPFDKGTQLEAQMNVLPLCTVPRALFTAKATAYVPPEATTARRRAAAAA
jgi:hypothetical protein